ncbi:hypothetical protein Leryth_010484 [Lithospermum erythrorhizon]|nr:hypothetical protein Leryth_010484 [Lithospermum erythrorhizon]
MEESMNVILCLWGLCFCMGYHIFGCGKEFEQSAKYIVGTNANGIRMWVSSICRFKPLEHNNGVDFDGYYIHSSLFGLAAVISSTYSVRSRLMILPYGAHGEFMVALKYVSLLLIFLFSFICHSLSIRFINQVNFLVNCPPDQYGTVTPAYVSQLLEKGFTLNTVGNRLFYAALPLLLWIFGPVLVFLCYITMVPVLLI